MTVPANVTRFLFELIGSSDTLRVMDFRVEEHLSSPFLVELTVATESDSLDIAGWLGKAGVLTMFHPQAPRVFHGEVVAVEQLETGRRFTRYRLNLAPKFELLRYRQGARVFQSLSVPEIIRKVFNEASIEDGDVRFELAASYSPRDYCVQYQESEFHFLSRLMEEEGLFYYFEHHPDRHVMVISDTNAVFPQVPQRYRIAYHPRGSMRPDQEVVYRFDGERNMVHNRATLGDYDYTRPNLSLRQGAGRGGQPELEFYHYPGGFRDPQAGSRYTGIRLEAFGVAGERYYGLTNSQWFSAGFLFDLTDLGGSESRGEYLITGTVHSGEQPQSLEEDATSEGSSYHVSFLAVPATVTYRPVPTHEKKLIPGAQTAFVTGPAGEEIYTDEYGRVKIQFHWDREGRYDEATSCWVRVSQAWAGKEWGALALPRVGQEVVVQFINGDPDRPVITGCVYHGVNRTPYELPENKARTLFRSQSYPGGGGHNELRIDDRKGAEQIYIRAQKDVDLHVRNDQKALVEQDSHLTVKGSHFEAVQQNRHEHTGGDRHCEIGGEALQAVGKDHHLKVSGSMMSQAGRDVHVKAGTRIVIESGTQLTLKGGAGFVVLDPSGVTIQGPMVRINSGGSAGSAKSASPAKPEKPSRPGSD